MRQYVLAAVLGCFIASVPCTALASNIAFDTAGDSAYNSGWTQGSNGGYGWGGGWSISTGDGAAVVTADPNSGGEINSPLGLGGRSWEVSGDLAITRQFGGEMQIGQTFAIDVDSAPGGEYGVGLLLPDIDDHLSIADNGGSTYDLLSSRAGKGIITNVTDIPVVNGPIQITFTRSDAADYTVGITPLLLGASTSTVSANFAGGSPDGFGLGGDYAPLYFNNISVTPEPSVFLGAAVVGLGLLRRRSL